MKMGFPGFRAGRRAAWLLTLAALPHLAGCGAPIEGDRLERLRADVKAAAPPAVCIRAIGPRPLTMGDRPADVTMPVIIEGTQVAEFHIFDLYFKAAFVATDELRALGLDAALSPAIWESRREGMQFAAHQITSEALSVALAEVGAQDEMPQLYLLDEDAKRELYASRRTLISARSAMPLRTRVPRTLVSVESETGPKLDVDVEVPAALQRPQPLGDSGYALRVERQFERFRKVDGVELEAPDGDLNEALVVIVTTPGGQTERRILFARHPDADELGARLALPFKMVFRRIARKPLTARDVRDAYFLGDDGDAPPLALELDVQLLEAVAEEAALSTARRARIVVGARFLDSRSGALLFEGKYDVSTKSDGTGASVVKGRYVLTLGEDDPIEKALRLAVRAVVRDGLPALGRSRARAGNN